MSQRQIHIEEVSRYFSGLGSVFLQQIDPSRNRRRFYVVEGVQGLFEISVRRTWGRIGSRGRSLEHSFREMNEALETASFIHRSKLAKGYVEVKGNKMSHS